MNNAQGRSDADVSGVPVKAPSAVDELVPATTLLDLPAALLVDIALRLAKGRETLARTCFGLFEAGLLHAPSFRLQLDRQCCDQLLSPRVVSALRARECKLAITLEQPRAQGSKLLAEVLGKLGICTAVEACKLSSLEEPSLAPAMPLDCSPSLAQCLMDSFPALTSLSLHNYAIPCSDLASLLSHPQLSLQLQQLDLTGTNILQPEQPEPGAATLDNLFHAFKGLDGFRAALQPLAQLQVLTISTKSETATWHLGLNELLQALPQLHTLQLPHATVRGEEQLDTLLAATQLTSVQLNSLMGLTSSRADVPCSWQRLELTSFLDTASAAHLPLHSLTQPLVLEWTEFNDEGMGGDPSLQMAAVHNLTQACKVPVRINDLWLSLSPDITGEEQQERLEQWVVVLQPLKHCSWGELTVYNLDVGGASSRSEADISALAPLCQGCTRLTFFQGTVEPSLEFWRQLVQLMPTVTEVVFTDVIEGSSSSAMHESLQLMAEQPWARLLDICIDVNMLEADLPACWRASPLPQPGKLKVSLNVH